MHWKRTLWVLFTAQLLSAIGFSTIFPFLPNYVEALGSSRGSPIFWVTAVYSVQAITMMIASPIWGALSDRVGRKPMVLRALLGGGLVTLLMAFVQSAEQLVALRALQGLLSGVVSASVSMVAAATPRRHIGYAMGLMQTSQWAGVSVGPVIGGVLAFTLGYRMSFVITAVLLGIGGVLVWTMVQERFERQPGKLGLGGMAAAWRAVLVAPGVAVAYLVRFTAWLGRDLIVPFLPLFVTAIVLRPELAGIHTGIAIGLASFTGTFSAILLGKLGDRIGHRPVLIVSALAAAAIYLPMTLIQHVWQLHLLNALAGAAVGGVLPAISALLAQFTADGQEGSVYGLDNAVIAAARSVGPVLGGGVVAIVSVGGVPEYRPIFVLATALFVVTAGLSAWRVPRRRGLRPERPAPQRA